MSIAVSAVVKPSRRLRALGLAYGFANFAAALAVGFCLPERFVLGPLSAICFLAVGGVSLSSAVRSTKMRQIDISGLGQIRLTVQQDMACNDVDGVAVALLPGSTIWPWLLLLRLGHDDGKVTVVPVLRDSVAPSVFRPLSVALGAIGGRSQPIFGTDKIL
ncbi:MAG TPA: flagellar hook-length control protein [Telluria sp.]|nr:flagellar hook-length control protein [Telluria sp.]